MTESEKLKLKQVMIELSNAMTRIAAERDFIKEAITSASDTYSINKKVLRRMARVYHKNNYSEELSSMEEFTTMYDDIINKK